MEILQHRHVTCSAPWVWTFQVSDAACQIGTIYIRLSLVHSSLAVNTALCDRFSSSWTMAQIKNMVRSFTGLVSLYSSARPHIRWDWISFRFCVLLVSIFMPLKFQIQKPLGFEVKGSCCRSTGNCIRKLERETCVGYEQCKCLWNKSEVLSKTRQSFWWCI